MVSNCAWVFAVVDRLLVNDINQGFELELFDEDAFSADDSIGVIEPQKLGQLLTINEEHCRSRAMHNPALMLPL